MISIHTEPIFDGVRVIFNGHVRGEVRAMKDGIHWNAVPLDDDRPTRTFDDEGRAVCYLISGW